MLLGLARSALALLLSALLNGLVLAAEPTDNPIAAYYAGPEGYPAWTDDVRWQNVVNMKTYAKGKNDYERFEKARDELAERGGVLYYPAGTYDFTPMPPGRGLFLRGGTVIRGEAPTGRPAAGDGKMTLPTKFVFGFRERGGGKVPGDWNVIGLMTEKEKRKGLKDVNQVGIAWVHLVGATVFFGPQVDWGKSWAATDPGVVGKIKKGWAERVPDGTHPFDALASGKKFEGVGKGRFVFGCVLEDAAWLDDFSDPGYGPNGFHTQRLVGRVAVYGSRVLVANNLLPRSKKNFLYRQKIAGRASDKGGVLAFDYGQTCGIDINKNLYVRAGADGACPGYFQEGIVVRDNFVYNHGNKGYSLSGNWVTATGNVNDRAFWRPDDNVYGLGPSGPITLDGWEIAGPTTDTLSRAFDLAGRNLWVDRNRFNSTGAASGTGGEGIVGRFAGGTMILSWAITHNTHTRGLGTGGGMGSADDDCFGLLVGWNQTPGWAGSMVTKKNTKMVDCAFVANKCERVVPDAKSAAKLGLPAPLTAASPGPLLPPEKVAAKVYEEDAVEITWAGSPGAVGFRVERQIEGGKWQAIAYRPPRPQANPDNPPAWIDFTAPSNKKLVYRVIALSAEDSDKTASESAAAVTIPKSGSP